MINVKRYIIDYGKLVTERIPADMYSNQMRAWLMQLIGQVVALYNSFVLFRNSVLYKIAITPQVCYLEKMLNDRYDSSLRRITIIDGLEYNPLFIYLDLENKPVYFFLKSETAKPKVYLYTAGEAGQFTFDFIVVVPVAVSFNLNEMIALLQQYKLASKIFSIQTV